MPERRAAEKRDLHLRGCGRGCVDGHLKPVVRVDCSWGRALVSPLWIAGPVEKRLPGMDAMVKAASGTHCHQASFLSGVSWSSSRLDGGETDLTMPVELSICTEEYSASANQMSTLGNVPCKPSPIEAAPFREYLRRCPPRQRQLVDRWLRRSVCCTADAGSNHG